MSGKNLLKSAHSLLSCLKGARWRAILGALLALILVPASAEQTPPKVYFFHPDTENTPFWGKVYDVMAAAADDLDVELHGVASKDNSISVKRSGTELVESLNRGDYLITGYWAISTAKFIEIAEQRGVKVFVINADFSEEENKDLGLPRTRYKRWIGHMYANDEQAGYELADSLIAEAIKAGKVAKDGKVHVVALYGGDKAVVPESRDRGLKRRVGAFSDATLDEVMSAMWDSTSAVPITLQMLNQYPEATVVWAASDSMAFGAIEAAKSLGKKPGTDIFVGGIDWSDQGIEAVATGMLSTSVGGHFLEGAWSLILVHDYHYGIDFADDPGVRSMTSMHSVTSDTVEDYKEKLSNPDWSRIDFKRFSKKYNPDLKKYDFSLQALLSAFDKGAAKNRTRNR
jgi:ABC-type sugar transport system substrate-binding protein